MQEDTFRIILMVLTISIVGIILRKAQSKKSTSMEDYIQHKTYIVRLPRILNTIGIGCIILGLIIIVVVTCITSQIVIGMFIFCFVLMICGLLCIAYYNSWHMEVNNNKVILYKLFGENKNFSISEINEVIVKKNNELVIYVNDKKIVNIDPLSENYDVIKQNLMDEGINLIVSSRI